MNRKDAIIFIILLILTTPIICTIIPTGSLHFMTVTGRSMEPTITSDDIIVISSKKTLIESGSIIAYYYQFEENPSKYIITHRVIGSTPSGYKTKGDGNKKPDNYIVPPGNVIGVMCFKIPYIGGLVHFVHTSIGFLAFVIVPSLILVIQEIKKLVETADK